MALPFTVVGGSAPLGSLNITGLLKEKLYGERELYLSAMGSTPFMRPNIGS